MDSADRLNIEVLPPGTMRPLTPAQKLAAALRLRQSAWDLAAAGIRAREPGLSESEVQQRVRELFLHARS
jgi:hypothetical protein